MKTFLARFWWIFGLLSVIMLGLCPQIGWYALSNAVIMASAAWLIHQALARLRRLDENRQILNRMSKKEKKAFAALDFREFQNLKSITQLMPWIFAGCLCLNVYTYFYNQRAGHSGAIADLYFPNGISLLLLILGIAFGILAGAAWNFRIRQVLDSPERLLQL